MGTYTLEAGRGARGPDRRRLFSTSATIGDGGTIDTGLATSVESAVAIGSAATAEILSIVSTTSGTLTFDITDNAGGAGSSQTVYAQAIGVN